MPIPGVPPGVRRRAFEAFLEILRGDPLLAHGRAIRTWITFDGKSPVAPPSVDAMPCLVARLLTGQVKRLASTRAPGSAMTYAVESHPVVQLDLFVPGTDQGAVADLADLIYRVMTPQAALPRAAIDRKLRSVGVQDYRLVREILPPSAEAFDEAFIAASGAYELTLVTRS